jgi:hypothetical protein
MSSNTFKALDYDEDEEEDYTVVKIKSPKNF